MGKWQMDVQRRTLLPLEDPGHKWATIDVYGMRAHLVCRRKSCGHVLDVEAGKLRVVVTTAARAGTKSFDPVPA